MHPFALSRADDAAKAIAAHALDPDFIAGGTDLIGLMKDRAVLPERLLGHQRLAEYGADRSAARRWRACRRLITHSTGLSKRAPAGSQG
jgi:CO/xanthine dehydrogenase FAD-binding subunit